MSGMASMNPPEHLEDLLRRIRDASTLPHVALRVMEITSDPDSDIKSLLQVIEGDAPLASKVLRTVNSAAYGVRSTISDLGQALNYLGYNQIRNLAMTVSVSRIFERTEAIGPYCRLALWKHLVAVGLCARLIAVRSRFSNFEDAFLAGLLHDLGLILEDQYVHKEFCTVMETLTPQSTLSQVEHEILGFDHAKLGYRMGKRWRFPEVVLASIRYHHTPSDYNGPAADVLHCVHVANALCTAKGITSVGLPLVKIDLRVIQTLNMTKDDLQVLASDLDAEIAKNHMLLEAA